MASMEQLRASVRKSLPEINNIKEKDLREKVETWLAWRWLSSWKLVLPPSILRAEVRSPNDSHPSWPETYRAA